MKTPPYCVGVKNTQLSPSQNANVQGTLTIFYGADAQSQRDPEEESPGSGPLAANVKGKPEIWDNTVIWAHVQDGGRDGLVRFRLWEEMTGVTFTQN